MPRVVPSQVVDLIDKLFPKATNEVEGKPVELKPDYSIQLMSIIELAEQIPSELISLSADRYAEYISAIAAIRWTTQRWQRVVSPLRSPMPPTIRGLRSHSAVALIRQALVACPDESPSIGTAEISFIPDNELRESLRRDLSAVNMALTNGEWKAATVLAGSVIEALLLWALQRNTTAAKDVFSKLGLKGVAADLEKWDLHAYIEVAADLNVIESQTATQCRLAKDFRNLIHPGRAERLGQQCNRATALSAVAALEHVVNDLTPR